MPLHSGLVQDAGNVKSDSGLTGAKQDHGEGMKAWGALLVKARSSTCEETMWPSTCIDGMTRTLWDAKATISSGVPGLGGSCGGRSTTPARRSMVSSDAHEFKRDTETADLLAKIQPKCTTLELTLPSPQQSNPYD